MRGALRGRHPLVDDPRGHPWRPVRRRRRSLGGSHPGIKRPLRIGACPRSNVIKYFCQALPRQIKHKLTPGLTALAQRCCCSAVPPEYRAPSSIKARMSFRKAVSNGLHSISHTVKSNGLREPERACARVGIAASPCKSKVRFRTMIISCGWTCDTPTSYVAGSSRGRGRCMDSHCSQ